MKQLAESELSDTAHGTHTAAGERVLALYREHGRALFAHAIGMLGRRTDAEDMVQEAFLKLDRHLRSGGDERNLRAWLYRVATNLCRDALRAERRHAGRADELDVVAPAASVSSEGLAIQRVFAKLKPRDRELVLMRARGLSYAEMALAQGLRAASVGKLLTRALERFAIEYRHETGREVDDHASSRK